jgi:hypothetical protein
MGSNNFTRVTIALTSKQIAALEPIRKAIKGEGGGGVLGQTFVSKKDPRSGQAEFYFLDYKSFLTVNKAIMKARGKTQRNNTLASSGTTDQGGPEE